MSACVSLVPILGKETLNIVREPLRLCRRLNESSLWILKVATDRRTFKGMRVWADVITSGDAMTHAKTWFMPG